MPTETRNSGVRVEQSKPPGRVARRHPVVRHVTSRFIYGIVTTLLVTVVIFGATQVLPGDAAFAFLGRQAASDPELLASVRHELGLDLPVWQQYTTWLGQLIHGDPGTSLSAKQPVTDIVRPALLNSAALASLGVIAGSLVACALGTWAALRKGSVGDRVATTSSLLLIGLPEFVVAIGLVILLGTLVFPVFPPVSTLRVGESPFDEPLKLVLPALTLVLLIYPYVYRMVRGVMIDVLKSDYVEFATVRGVPWRRTLFRHALPNAIPPVAQILGQVTLYATGGAVVVEYIFNYPGIGQALVTAVSTRDIPTLQFIIVILSCCYVVVNILTDLVALAASPRKRVES